ncbi:MAG: Calx-beta domain-containing protein, partial [Planctomycetota bacterium]
MLKKAVLLLSLVLITVGLENADAFLFQLDIGDLGQPVKAGWDEFSGNANNESDPKTEIYDVNGLSISVSIQTGLIDDSGYRYYGGGDLGGDMVFPDNFNGPVNGRVILTLGNLPVGDYTLASYHNDTQGSHAQQDPIDVTVTGAVTTSTSDLDVVQTKCADDSCLGQSTVTFTAAGTGDVVITYTPTTDAGVVSKATLCGFELDFLSTTTLVQFETDSSASPENSGTVYVTVNVYNPDDVNTVTVNYAVTGGTADGGGVDYTLEPNTLTFPPMSTTQQIEISLVNDGAGEEDETIEITLSNSINATLGAITQHIFTIQDLNPYVEFETTAGQSPESVSPALVPVTLSKPWTETVTVDYLVTGGTALGNGVDYTLEDGALSFDPCEVTKYISITLIEDRIRENPDETIEITLSNPSHAKLGTQSQYTFTLLPPVIQFCPSGDLDGDCDVDGNDLGLFCNQWLDPAGSCSGYSCANFNKLGGVDMADFARLATNWTSKIFPVVINELLASNDYVLEDPNESGEYPDWVELYNTSPLPIDLSGMYMTDKLDNPTKWRIPDGLIIGPWEYLVFYADEDPEQGPTHMDFKLKAAGEAIALFDTDGSTLLRSITFEEQVTDVSYGRYPDASDNLRFMGGPSPGSTNGGAYHGNVADIKFSHERGFYDSSFNLSLICETPGAKIYYTLDGSKPTTYNGTFYSGTPLNISQTTVIRAGGFRPAFLQSRIETQSYVFLGDVVSQPDMHPGVVAAYSAVIEDSFKSIPTLSIALSATDLANLQLQDSRDGPTDPHPKEEFSASAELIYSDVNDGEGIHINCAIEGHSWALDKRSYKLIFNTEFGPSKLEYPFFESAVHHSDSAVEQFDRIVLRASKNMNVTYAGDQWTRDTQIQMNELGARGAFIHLYINGTYFGIYNATERPDASFSSSYLGGEKDDYFATNHGYERGEDHISGDPNRFDDMISMALGQNLEDPNTYETFKGLCDVSNFADYTILYWFSGFGDGIDNNWYAGMRNVPLIGEVPPE